MVCPVSQPPDVSLRRSSEPKNALAESVSKFIIIMKKKLKIFFVVIAIVLAVLYLGQVWSQKKRARIEGLYLANDGKTIVFIDKNNWYEFVVDGNNFRLGQQPIGYSYSIFDSELKLNSLLYAPKVLVQVNNSQVTLTRKFPAVPCKGFESHEMVYEKFSCPKVGLSPFEIEIMKQNTE